MKNLRKSAIAALAAVAVLSASALATPSVAEAGSKRDLAGAIVGGLIVGAIIGANTQPGPVVVQRPRVQHFGGNGFRGQRNGFRGHRQVSNFGNNGCFTKEVVTIDQWGNRASSLQTICR